MKLKTKEQFEEIADIQLCYYWGSHGRIPREGVRDLLALTLEQHQQDLLASASEGFEDYCVDRIIRGAYKHERVFNAVTGNYLNLNDCEQLWQACSLHHAKKMQEKDAQIYELQKEIDELKKQRDIALNDLSIEAREVDELKSENEELKKDILHIYKDLRNNCDSDTEEIFEAKEILKKWFKGEAKGGDHE